MIENKVLGRRLKIKLNQRENVKSVHIYHNHQMHSHKVKGKSKIKTRNFLQNKSCILEGLILYLKETMLESYLALFIDP